MKHLTIKSTLLLALTFALAGLAMADTIPLPPLSGVGANYTVPGSPGTYAVYAYYGGSSAGDISVSFLNSPMVNLFKNNGPGASQIGDTIFLGNFSAGTTLVFGITDQSVPNTFYTGTQNAAVQPFSGGTFNGVTFPIGSLIRFEDRPIQGSDLDYNDLVFTVSAKPVPEPATMLLLGSGLAGLGGAIRKRKKNQG